MWIAVTGGRELGQVDRVCRELDEFMDRHPPIIRLIHGDCPTKLGKPASLDRTAKEWAIDQGIELDPYPAKWSDLDEVPCKIRYNSRGAYNVLAGFNRNLVMLREGKPDRLLVFPGGNGTQHCWDHAVRMGIPVTLMMRG